MNVSKFPGPDVELVRTGETTFPRIILLCEIIAKQLILIHKQFNITQKRWGLLRTSPKSSNTSSSPSAILGMDI